MKILMIVLIMGSLAISSRAFSKTECNVKPDEQLILIWEDIQNYLGIADEVKLKEEINYQGSLTTVAALISKSFGYSINLNWTNAKLRKLKIEILEKLFLELDRDEIEKNDRFELVKLRPTKFPSTGIIGLNTNHEKMVTTVILGLRLEGLSKQEKTVGEANAAVLEELKERFFKASDCLAQWVEVKAAPSLVHF